MMWIMLLQITVFWGSQDYLQAEFDFRQNYTEGAGKGTHARKFLAFLFLLKPHATISSCGSLCHEKEKEKEKKEILTTSLLIFFPPSRSASLSRKH